MFCRIAVPSIFAISSGKTSVTFLHKKFCVTLFCFCLPYRCYFVDSDKFGIAGKVLKVQNIYTLPGKFSIAFFVYWGKYIRWSEYFEKWSKQFLTENWGVKIMNRHLIYLHYFVSVTFVDLYYFSTCI